MPGAGLDQLTTEQKRALLAERLWQRSSAATPAKPPVNGGGSPLQDSNESRRSFLDREVIALSSLKDWRVEEQGPYTRHVAPYKGFLYQRLGMDKTFVRGEGCYLFDAGGTGYADSGDHVDPGRARRAGCATARDSAARLRPRRLHQQRR